MKNIFITAVSLLTFISISFYSCKKEISCEDCANDKTNKPPIANAGPDQLITLPTDSVLLDGSTSSDPDGSISSYSWTKISGPASFNILKPSDSVTKVKVLVKGTYQFELKVTDNGGLSASDTLRIIVDSTLITNHPPIANAGTDQTITLPTNLTNLDGRSSSDPDNNIANYIWTKIYGPTSSIITNASSVQTQVTNLVEGLYGFELKVTDAGGLFSKDTVQVIVQLVSPPPLTNCDISNRPLVNAQLIPIGTLSQTRANVTIGAAGNKIVFAGGSTPQPQAGCSVSGVDILDINSNTWTTGDISEARYDMGVATVGNKIFFAGGYRPQFFPNSTTCFIGNSFYPETRSSVIDIYDASSNSWSTSQLSSRLRPCGAAAGNKVLFAGGDIWPVISIPSNAIDIFDASNYLPVTTSLSELKGFQQIATSGSKIFLAGGTNQLADCDNNVILISKRVDIYDASTGTWSSDLLSQERAGNGAIGVNNKIYWAGGYIKDNNAYCGISPTNSVEIRDLSSNTTSFDCLSEAKEQVTALLKNNKIIFWGGQNGRFDIYDLSSGTWSIGVLPQNLSSASVFSYNDTIYVAGAFVNGTLSNQVWKLEF